MTHEDAHLATLVANLEAAQAQAAELAGRPPAGVRAVEPVPGERRYLCGFADGLVLCLDADNRPLPSREALRAALTVALLVEEVEAQVDAAELRALAGIAGRAAAHASEPAAGTLQALARTATDLADWRDAPQRAVARVDALDQAVGLHDGARAAYLRFVAATDPLVAIQDTLATELRDALRDVETASGATGLTAPFAPRVAEALERAANGALELAERSLLPADD